MSSAAQKYFNLTKVSCGITHNGWVFVSGFALHNAQFKAQMLMAKLAQIPCYALVPVKLVGTQFETLKKRI